MTAFALATSNDCFERPKRIKHTCGLGFVGWFDLFTDYRLVSILPYTFARHQAVPSVKHSAVLVETEALAVPTLPAPSLGSDVG